MNSSFYGLLRMFVTSRIEKGDCVVSCCLLDFSLVQDRSERFSAAFKESDRELHSFAALVFSSSHLPSLLRSTNFFLTFGTFSHNIPFSKDYIR